MKKLKQQNRKTTMFKFKRTATPYLYLAPTMVLFFALMLVPVVTVVGYSFFDNVIMNRHPVFDGLNNYRMILTDPVFYESLLNTAIFVGMSVVAHITLGMFFALLLNSSLLHAIPKAIYRVIYIIPWVFTVSIIAVLWRLLLNPNGVITYFLNVLGTVQGHIDWLGSRDTALGVVTFVNIWSGYPFYLVSILAGLQGISNQLYEAATVDGAGTFQKLVCITIPQLKPILMSLTILDCIWTTQQYALVWMLTGGGPVHATEMISTYTYKLAFSSYEFSRASASAVIVLMISLLLIFLYVKAQKAREST